MGHLVLCMTNYVTVNDVANAILAIKCSPVMGDDINDVEDLAKMADALVINIGTVNRRTLKSMLSACKYAKNIVLDPVGAGVSKIRNKAIKKLLKKVHFSVIRGNLSEISYIAGFKTKAHGVDNSLDGNGIEVAKMVSQKYKCIVAITGKVDIVTDGVKVAKISNGVEQMKYVTGTGCMLTGIIASKIINTNAFDGTKEALLLMGIAGELAYKEYKGNGSFHIGIIDKLSTIDETTIKELGRIEYEEN